MDVDIFCPVVPLCIAVWATICPPLPPCRGRERFNQLEELLERKRHLLTLASGLADGGQRVRSQIAELEQELETARRGPSGGAAASGASCSDAASGSAADPAVAPAVPHAVPIVDVGKGLAFRSAGASSSLLAAAASAPLPSGKSAGHVVAPAEPWAAPTAATAAAAAAELAHGSKPAASPLFARMRGMLWGSAGKQQAAAVPSGGAPPAARAGAGRELAFGSQPAALGNAPAAPGTKQAMPQQAEQRPQQQAPPPQPQQAGTRKDDQASGTAPAQPAQELSQAAAPPKAPCSHREVKARLMETLREIKQLEGGGMFDRRRMEKLRRRAARLAAQYEAGRDAEEAAAGDGAS